MVLALMFSLSGCSGSGAGKEDAGEQDAEENDAGGGDGGDAEETFGAEPNPTGNPLGGGEGYNDILLETDARVSCVVSTKDELLACLARAESGDMIDVIYVKEDANIDMTGTYGTTIPAGVTLASNRGSAGSQGGRIFRLRLPTDPHLSVDWSTVSTLYIVGDNVRITGLRLEGPDLTRASVGEEGHILYGIMLTHYKGLEVDNNEIFGWSGAGILQDTWHTGITDGGLESPEIGSDILNIHHNYIHNCWSDSRGYGVAVYRNGAALIKGNIFDYTRHAICSDGYPNSGYEASYNVHLGHSSDHVFDVHGNSYLGNIVAGTLFRVHHNTVHVGYPGELRQPWSVAVRGIPQQQFYITFNDFPHTNYWGVAQEAAHDSPVTQYDFGGMGSVSMTNNLVDGVFSADGPIKQCHQISFDDFTCGYQ
jgi:hypothetical protein